MPENPTQFDLWGHPQKSELDWPLNLKEVTIGADPPLLRRLAEFFVYAADKQEKYGSDFAPTHFCDYAEVPREQQRLADIIISRRFVEGD